MPLDDSGQLKVSQASYDYVRPYWDQIGATIAGRRVFDLTDGWDGIPSAGVDHVVVVTHRPPPEGWDPTAPFTFVEGVEAAVATAQELAGDRLVEDPAVVIQATACCTCATRCAADRSGTFGRQHRDQRPLEQWGPVLLCWWRDPPSEEPVRGGPGSAARPRRPCHGSVVVPEQPGPDPHPTIEATGLEEEMTMTRMRRSLLGAFLALLLLATAASAAVADPATGSGGRGPAVEHVRPRPPLHAAHGFLRSTVARMSLEEKVGQLFATWAYGRHAHDTTWASVNQASYGVDTPAELVDKYHLGGILYFTWSNNIESPAQLAQLSNGLQETALAQPSGVPLFLTIDQETGSVNRMNAPATEFPGSMSLGATRSEALAEQVWTVVGRELDAVGVNMNFAPVLDVNTNPANPVIGLRSIGEDPDLVGSLGTTAVQAMQAAGVSATVKHFPGHGDTSTDSHYGLPLVDYDRDTLMGVHVAPFRQAIEGGVDAVMTAHMVVEAVDPDLPSTLSRDVLTGLLREELGFDGLIVTDALNMAALTQFWTQDEIAVRALEAGADVLLMPDDLPLAYQGVLDAVRSRRLSLRRIEESVMRILQTKYDRGLFHDPLVDTARVDEVVGVPEHLAIADTAARQGVTVVRNDGDLLPLAGAAVVVGPSAANTAALAARMTELGADATLQTVSTSPSASQRAAAVAAAEDADVVVVTTTNARGNANQRALVADLAATGTPVVAVNASLPYDAAYVPSADAVLLTYSTRPVALRAVADVLLGEVSPQGRLPVTVPAGPDSPGYPYGHGLTW